jgi:hypothetical protein
MPNPIKFPSDRTNPAGAIPIYLVAPPAIRGGTAQNNPGGAIPIFITVAPTNPNSGAIPVRIVAATGPGPKWSNDQSNDLAACPAFEDPTGIPVWEV